jgi:hypothetical protein
MTQTQLLQLLAKQPHTITSIVRHLEMCSFPAGRKAIISALGKLMQKKLVARVKGRTGGFGTPDEPIYGILPAGVTVVKSGKRITSGPNGKLTGIRKPQPNSFRARLWRAMRIQKKFTIPQLLELVRVKTDAATIDNSAMKYLAALARAGVVAKLPTREKGYALTSPGHVRWALIRDFGPLAPVVSTKHLIDANAEGDARFIPYAPPTPAVIPAKAGTQPARVCAPKKSTVQR